MRWQIGLPGADFDAEVARLIDLGAVGDPPTLSHPAGNDFDVVPVEGDRRFTSIIIEALDVPRVQTFWRELLKGVRHVTPIPDPTFVQAAEPKRVKNRMHLDLFCEEPGEIDDERRRAVELGARLEDSEGAHKGMFDPEGNEFCLRGALPRPPSGQ